MEKIATPPDSGRVYSHSVQQLGDHGELLLIEVDTLEGYAGVDVLSLVLAHVQKLCAGRLLLNKPVLGWVEQGVFRDMVGDVFRQ